MDEDSISIVDGISKSMKTQPCVLFVVMPFGRVDEQTFKKVKLLRFCTEMTTKNCFLNFTKAEELDENGTMLCTSRQRDPSAQVQAMNEKVRIADASPDLFVVGRNVACVGNDPDTNTTLNGICDLLHRMSPIRRRYTYTEMRQELQAQEDVLSSRIAEADEAIADNDEKIQQYNNEYTKYLTLAQREQDKSSALRSQQGMLPIVLQSVAENAAATVLWLQSRARDMQVRSTHLANARERNEQVRQRLNADKARISTVTNYDMVWEATLQQIRARLHLAAIKTIDLFQRTQVSQAIIVPKLLFTARHSWPSARQVERLQVFLDNYAWRGLLAEDKRHGRAWVSPDVARAPRQEGGHQIPCLRSEFLIMAATTVQRWASATPPIRAAVGQVLLRDRPCGSLAPARGPSPQPRSTGSIVSSGYSVLRAAVCVPFSDDERDAITPLLARAGKAPPSEGTWEHGWYRRTYQSTYSSLKAVRAIQRQRAGKLNVSSLLHSQIIGADLLLHKTGRPLQVSDLPGLGIAQQTVQELVEIHWINSTTLGFRLRGATYPYDAARSSDPSATPSSCAIQNCSYHKTRPSTSRKEAPHTIFGC